MATEFANKILKTTGNGREAIVTGVKQARLHFANLEKKMRRMNDNNLKRFLDAQQRDYSIALTEIKAGRKRSHSMWYIFPQIGGLGYSVMSKRYAIMDLPEAMCYLAHPVLGKRLVEMAAVLLKLKSLRATDIMGCPDGIKLRSSMTLFAQVPDVDAVLKPY